MNRKQWDNLSDDDKWGCFQMVKIAIDNQKILAKTTKAAIETMAMISDQYDKELAWMELMELSLHVYAEGIIPLNEPNGKK